MDDDKRVNFKLDAISKLINNVKLSISGNKEHEELDTNNVIVNLDEISQKITEFHNMVQTEFDQFEDQHKTESDETQVLLNNRFNIIDAELIDIKSSINDMKTVINDKLSHIDDSIIRLGNNIITAINAMKTSNDTKNDAIISALNGLVSRINQNTNNISSLDNRVSSLENI